MSRHHAACTAYHRSAHTVLESKLAAFCSSCLSKLSRRRTQDYHEQEAHGRGESPSAISVNTGQGSWRYPCGRSACVLTAVEVVAGGVSAEGVQDSATLRGAPSALEKACSLAADGDGRGVCGASISAGAAAHQKVPFRTSTCVWTALAWLPPAITAANIPPGCIW